MTTRHDARHEELLQGILSGDVAPTSPAAAPVQVCPVCQERLAAMRAMTARLEAAGREQRAILAEARRSPASPDEDRVPELVRAGLRARRTSPAVRRWPWLAAAAALLLGVLSWWVFAQDDPAHRPAQRPPDQLLTVDKPWPVGAVEDLAEFRWPGDRDETYQLLLFQASDPVRPWEVLECTGNRRVVEPGFVARMRGVATEWTWRYERTSAQRPGSPSVAVSEDHRFSLSR